MLPALPAKIRLGRTRLIARNSLAYYCAKIITEVKRAIVWTVFTTLYFIRNLRIGDYASLERLGGDKHSSLLDPFVSYADYKVL
jgi:hypothetical protein